jgi:hypothetical protein
MMQETPVPASFRISLLGPSGVGKTSLVTAMLAESQKILAGSGAAMRPVGRRTSDAIARNQFQLEEYLLAGEFTADRFRLQGTREAFIFTLGFDLRAPGSGISIDLLDFPGGWLSARRTRADYGPLWREARDFIVGSTILLMPVDATMLMEASTSEQRDAVRRLLAIEDMTEIAREWATARRERSAEPALAVFCPLKCESYFSDNGGISDRSTLLRTKVEEVYRDVISAIEAKAPEAAILYAPIDTLGCVELVGADWISDDLSGLDLQARYRVRGSHPKISRVGAGDLVRVLCSNLAQGVEALEKSGREVPSERTGGFFRMVWLMLRGERGARRQGAEATGSPAPRASSLGDVVTEIASSPYGPRVREL